MFLNTRYVYEFILYILDAALLKPCFNFQVYFLTLHHMEVYLLDASERVK